MNLKWKVCGMRNQLNIKQVLILKPDYMGFIFYKKSPRYVGEKWSGPGNEFPSSTKRVGVFVNESPDQIRMLAERYKFDYLQLHGDESAEYCQQLSQEGYALIKAVAIKETGDLAQLEHYKPWIKYFLFDTPGSGYGGTGNTFEWALLEQYDNQIPIFLSGGISLENVQGIGRLKQLNLATIDVNSRFESEPGLKDPGMLSELKKQLQQL